MWVSGGLSWVSECSPEVGWAISLDLDSGDLCWSAGEGMHAVCFLNLAQLFIFHRTNTKVCVDYTAAATEIYWDVVSAIIIYNSWHLPQSHSVAVPCWYIWLMSLWALHKSITHQWNTFTCGIQHSESWMAALHLRLWVGTKKHPTSNWPWQIQFKLRRDIFPPIRQNVINFPCGKLFKTDVLVNYGLRDPITSRSIKTYCASQNSNKNMIILTAFLVIWCMTDTGCKVIFCQVGAFI